MRNDAWSHTFIWTLLFSICNLRVHQLPIKCKFEKPKLVKWGKWLRYLFPFVLIGFEMVLIILNLVSLFRPPKRTPHIKVLTHSVIGAVHKVCHAIFDDF